MLLKILAFILSAVMMISSTPFNGFVDEGSDLLGDSAVNSAVSGDVSDSEQNENSDDFLVKEDVESPTVFVATAPLITLKGGTSFASGTPVTVTSNCELTSLSLTADSGLKLSSSYTLTTAGTDSIVKYVYKYTTTGGTYNGTATVVTFTANYTYGSTTSTAKTTAKILKTPISSGSLNFKFSFSYKRQDSWGSVTSNPVLKYTLSVSGLHKVSTSSVYDKSGSLKSSDNYDSKTWTVNYGDISSTYNGRFYYDTNTSNKIGSDYGATSLSNVKFSIYNPSNVMSEEGDGTPVAKEVRFATNYEDYMRYDTGFEYKFFDLLTMETPGTIDYYLSSAPYSAHNSNGIDTVKYSTTGIAGCTGSSSSITVKYIFAITYEWVNSTKLWNIYKSENALNRFAYSDLYKEADSDAWADYLDAYSDATTILAGGYSQSAINTAADNLVNAVSALKTKIVYDKNSGTGDCADYEYVEVYSEVSVTADKIQTPVYFYNDVILLSYSGLTNVGFACTGWSTDKTATQGTTFLTLTDEATKVPIILYAAWNPVEYTVVYNPNKPAGASTVVGTMERQNCLYGQEYYYLANGFTITNYTFACWNTKPDGSGINAFPGDKLLNLTDKNETVNLYAIWQNGSINITLNINLPTGVTETTRGPKENVTVALEIGKVVSLAEYQMDANGYRHIGWSTKKGATTPTFTIGMTVPQIPTTLYAVWQKKTVKVNYALNGGELSEGDYTANGTVVPCGDTITLPDKTEVKRNGYELSGWKCSIDGKFYTDTLVVPNTSSTSVTLTAEWTYGTTTITLHDNNVELTDVTRTVSGTYMSTLDKNLFAAPEKTAVLNGYTFAGWYIKEGTSYVPYTIPSTFPASDTDLYAGWRMTELAATIASVPSDIYDVVNGDPYYYYPKDDKDAVLDALEDAEEVYGTSGVICNPTDLRIANLTTQTLKITLSVLAYKNADYSQVDIYRTYYEEILAGTHSHQDDQGNIRTNVSKEYFTDESFAELKNAYDSVYDGALASQQSTVDAWAAALKSAYESLEIKLADYTQLHKYYEICYELNGNDTNVFNENGDGNKYYSDGWTDFFDVVWNVAKVECEEGREFSYQSVVDDYTMLLEETYNMMQLRAPDFSEFTEELQTTANNINAQSEVYDTAYRSLVVEALMMVTAAQNNGDLTLKDDQAYVDEIIATLKSLVENPVYRSYVVTFHYNGDYAYDVIGESTLPCNASISLAAPFEDPEREGYIFLGWYTTPEDTEDEIGRKIDFATTTELMGTADRDIYARWEITDNGFKLEITGTNATINVAFYENELKNEGAEYNNDNVFRGTPVILKAEATADGAEFLYWADGNGRIVSRNAEYNFVLVADAKLEAVYSEGIERESYKVIFVDGVTNKVISIVETQADTSAEAPALIDHVGYKFTGYSTSLQITKDTVIYAEYEKASESYTVTVTNGKGTLEPTGEYGYNTKVTVSLKESEIPEGKYFAGWTLDGGNTIVSYEMTYTFYVYGDTEVEALFADVKTEKSSTVTIAVTDKTETSVAFMVSREIAEDEFFLSSGLLITKDEANATEEALTLDNESENEAIRNFTTLRNEKVGQYKLTVSSSTPGTEYYARGYIVFRDADGKIAVKYTEVVKVTL